VPRAPAGRIVFAEVDGLEPSGLELARTALWRSAFRYVSFDGGFRYRVFPDVNDELILSAPRSVDFPPPFALARNPRTMTFEIDDGPAVADGELTVRFYSRAVRPRSRPAQAG
jgi:hypothetical protein